MNIREPPRDRDFRDREPPRDREREPIRDRDLLGIGTLEKESLLEIEPPRDRLISEV
jgi:hypothetical protein